MADPFTMAASMVTSAVGSISQGNAQASQELGNAAVAKENARRARMTAVSIQQAGDAAEQAKRREILKSMGTSAAAISQAGTGGPSVGSNALLLKQAGTEGEFDAQTLRYGYSMDAYNQNLEASNQDAAAKAAKRRARDARTSGLIGAAAQIFGQVASYGNMGAQRRLIASQQTAINEAPFAGHETWGTGNGLVQYNFG